MCVCVRTESVYKKKSRRRKKGEEGKGLRPPPRKMKRKRFDSPPPPSLGVWTLAPAAEEAAEMGEKQNHRSTDRISLFREGPLPVTFSYRWWGDE